MNDGYNSADNSARDLELAIKDKVDMEGKLSVIDSQIAKLSTTLSMVKKKKEKVEQKHSKAIHATQVQLCCAYVDIELLKLGTMVIGQLASFVTSAHEGRTMLDLAKKDMFNYLATSKLMAVEWAKLQGFSFDLSRIDLDNIEGFDGAIAKVTEDLKLLKYLLAEAKNFNSFPEEIHIPNAPETFKVADEKCLAKDPAHEVPKLSKRRMVCFSEIDLNVKIKLPRDLFGSLNEGAWDEVLILGLGDLVFTKVGDTTSTLAYDSTSVGSTWVATGAYDDTP